MSYLSKPRCHLNVFSLSISPLLRVAICVTQFCEILIVTNASSETAHVDNVMELAAYIGTEHADYAFADIILIENSETIDASTHLRGIHSHYSFSMSCRTVGAVTYRKWPCYCQSCRADDTAGCHNLHRAGELKNIQLKVSGQKVVSRRNTENDEEDGGSDEEEYEVDKIVGKRMYNGVQQYKVRWAGCNSTLDSWLHASNLRNAPQAVRDFESAFI